MDPTWIVLALIFLASLGGWVSLGQMGLYGLAGFAVGNLVQADGGAKSLHMDIWIASLLALVITVLVGLLLSLGALLGGCSTNGPKKSAIPWSAPASWEGQIPGMGPSVGR